MTAAELLRVIEDRVVVTGATSYRLGAGYMRVVSVEQPDLDALLGALRAVLDLHRPAEPEPVACGHCGHWGETWPCETVAAIIGAMGGAE